jgi:hypothetical protein
VVYQEIIMASPRHRKPSEKVHGDAFPMPTWYWQWHIEAKIYVAWLACAAKNTTSKNFHHLLLHLWLVHIPLQFFHYRRYFKMSKDLASVIFPHQMNSSDLWYAQFFLLVQQHILEFIFISFHGNDLSLL